jgi:hypothetical protein
MWFSAHAAVLCLLCLLWLMWLGCSSTGAAQAFSARQGFPSALHDNPLVASQVQPLLGDEEMLDAARARRASPGAFVAREWSRTAHKRLDTVRARALALTRSGGCQRRRLFCLAWRVGR